jgi:hypothetical protein
MAAQTLTAASNYDGPSLMLGLNNGEVITINGGALTIDSDVRWGQNAAVFGSMTVSATLGGSVLFEGRNVWELPYTAASGNVPAQNALGSNGVAGGTSGATGELLRVWAAGSLTPSASGGAMPASGWVKLRSKAGTFQSGEVVTLPGGATITISGAGKRSWLHMVGAESGTLTIPRLADVKFRGDWYELGATNGSDDQTIQYPIADSCPALWIERYPGAYAAEGNAGLESWLNAGPRWGAATAIVAQDVRGKYFGQNLTTGVITIAQRASNACGFKPAAGLRVFIPNLIFSNSNATNWALNTRSTSFTTRYELSALQAGAVDATYCAFNWYINVIGAQEFTFSGVSTLDTMTLSNFGLRAHMTDFALGLSDGTVGLNNGLSMSSMFDGIDMTRARFTRYAPSSTYGTFTDLPNSSFTDVQFEQLGGASGVFNINGMDKSQFTRLAGVGVRYTFSRTSDSEFTDPSYADLAIGTTPAAARSVIELTNASSRNRVKGFSNFGNLPNVHPYQAILSVSTGSVGNELSDVGSPATPYDCGSLNPMGSAINTASMKGVTARRVSLTGNRLEPVVNTNSSANIALINVIASTAVVQTRASSDMTVRGCRTGADVSGRSNVFGSFFGDVFTGDTAGAVLLSCNEPSAASAGQVSTTLAAGSGFTGAGSISMAALGDSITWTMDYFALGHTGLASTAPAITGTKVGNHLLEFQADTGSGWSAWATLTGPNLAAVGAINPAVGVRLRVRATVITASASNLLTNIRIDTVTDAVSQRTQYPLPKLAALTLTGLQPGSDIVILQAGTETELANVDANGSTTYAYDYDTTTTVDIGVFKVGFVPFYSRGYTLASTDATLPIAQVADRNYRNPT